MKRIIFIMTFAFAVLAINAQDLSRSFELGRNDIFLRYTGVIADSIGNTQDTLEYKWFINKEYDLLYDFQVKISEIRGRGLNTVSLQGRKFSTDAWTNITSTVYWGGGSDTTINFTQHTIASVVPWNHLRIYITESTSLGATKVNFINGAVKHN